MCVTHPIRHRNVCGLPTLLHFHIPSLLSLRIYTTQISEDDSLEWHLVIGVLDKKLSYRRRTARCVVSVEILPIATQHCRNYFYDKS